MIASRLKRRSERAPTERKCEVANAREETNYSDSNEEGREWYGLPARESESQVIARRVQMNEEDIN